MKIYKTSLKATIGMGIFTYLFFAIALDDFFYLFKMGQSWNFYIIFWVFVLLCAFYCYLILALVESSGE